MDILLLLLASLTSMINCHMSPLVAFYDNLPAIYKTDKGWVINETIKGKLTNFSEIVDFCKEMYPSFNITNAVPLFRKEIITNWCPINQTCTAQDQYEIHPIQCFNDSYTPKPISIPSYCKFNIDQGKGCLPYHTWKQKAKSVCDNNDQDLRDLQVIFPCQNEKMTFSEVEFICCAEDGERNQYSPYLKSKLHDILNIYRPVLHIYQHNKKIHIEHKLFSDTKHKVVNNYKGALGFLNKELKENLMLIMKRNNELTTQQYKDDENNLFKVYKNNYESITHQFKNDLFHLDNIHIKRIIRKADNKCRIKKNTEPDLLTCLIELKNISIRIIEHYNRILQLIKFDLQEYHSFMESRLKHLYSRYVPLMHGNKTLTKEFHEQLKEYSLKLKSNFISKENWLDISIRNAFERCKKDARLYLHYSEHYLSLAPMFGIITIIFFVFIVVVSILVYKYWNNPFRRVTHNYVMRVVGEPDQSSQSINKPELKLNLYENPIFNSKSSSKPIEKRSLIENMEN